MTRWQPVSELTPEIVESAWRLIVWTQQEGEWLCQQWTTIEGYDIEEVGNSWQVVFNGIISDKFCPITYFAVIDAPPEG